MAFQQALHHLPAPVLSLALSLRRADLLSILHLDSDQRVPAVMHLIYQTDVLFAMHLKGTKCQR